MKALNAAHKKNKERGFILMTSYLLISSITVVSFALFARNTSFMQANERSQNKIVAFNMAEAGIDVALSQLAVDPNYTGTNGYVSLSTDNVQGGYDVTVTTPLNAPMTRLIEAVGRAPGNNINDRAFETRSITVMRNSAKCPFSTLPFSRMNRCRSTEIRSSTATIPGTAPTETETRAPTAISAPIVLYRAR